MSATPRPATTVVLARPAPGGAEVFLLRRSRAVGFMPNAWVFPGGRVDAADADFVDQGGEAAASRLGMSAAALRPWLVAAVREVFEESGLWLGHGSPSPDDRARLLGGASFADVARAAGLVADLEGLVPWSWWVTPAVEPRRYDTRFFLARAPAGEASPDAGETVEARWTRPVEAVRAAEAGELPMAPPTWWTLRELMDTGDLDDWLAAERSIHPIEPIGHATDAGVELWLPGHPEHPTPAIPGLPPRVVFSQGRWWAGDRASPPKLNG